MPNKTTPLKSTTARGYGNDHQIHRSRLMSRHIDGTRCWWCARKMFRDPKRNFDGRPLEADHERTLSTAGVGNTDANRLLHCRCNRQRGDGTRDHERPALNPDNIDALDEAELETEALLGVRVHAWP